MVLVDAFGDIGIFGGGRGLPGLDSLPEFIADDPQFGNALDDPLRFRVQPRDALSGRRVFEIAQPVPDPI